MTHNSRITVPLKHVHPITDARTVRGDADKRAQAARARVASDRDKRTSRAKFKWHCVCIVIGTAGFLLLHLPCFHLLILAAPLLPDITPQVALFIQETIDRFLQI